MDKGQSFEQCLTELEKIVELMENGDITLEETIKYYKEAQELSKHCTKQLDKAEKEIKILKDIDE